MAQSVHAAPSLEHVLEQLKNAKPEVVDEIQALQAIFGEDKITLHPNSGKSWQPGQTLRLLLETHLPSHEDVELSLIVGAPSTYPESSPPQLQLANKYIGEHAVDSEIFGKITRIYMQENTWSPGDVAIFEGVERARELAEQFLDNKRSELAVIEAANPHSTPEDAKEVHESGTHDGNELDDTNGHVPVYAAPALPDECKLFVSDAIVDRKSVFVGHACQVKTRDEVSQVMNYLLSDKKIAKAAHNILAYRCRDGGVLYQDNDDDGETAAGSRLAHLLQIMEVENVMVVVTRWYGGIHLGSDRFKHINQAARDALVAGSFVQQATKK